MEIPGWVIKSQQGSNRALAGLSFLSGCCGGLAGPLPSRGRGMCLGRNSKRENDRQFAPCSRINWGGGPRLLESSRVRRARRGWCGPRCLGCS